MTAVLASASASRAVRARTVAWTTSVRAGGPVRGSIRWCATRPSCDPAMDARARRRQAEPPAAARGRDPTRSSSTRSSPRRARVGDPEPPALAAAEPDRDVAVGIDDGRRERGQPGERPIGEPALGDAVEVEPEADRAADVASRGRPRSIDQRPVDRRAPARRCPRRRRALGGEPRVEQRDVDDPVAQALGLPAQSRTAASVGPTGTRAVGRGVQAGEVGGRREPGQAVGPGPEPAQRSIEPRGAPRRRSAAADRPDEVDADGAAHQAGRRHERPPIDADAAAARSTGASAGDGLVRSVDATLMACARLAGRDDHDPRLRRRAPA